MFVYLFLLFTVVPAVELALLIKVGTLIGVMNTLLIIVFTGLFGAYFARLQGFLVLYKIQENLNRGNLPSAELLDGLMILIGGIFLITPGLVTDTFGFLLLIPWTRSLIKIVFKHKLEDMLKKGQVIKITPFGQSKSRFDNYDDIEVN